MTSRRILLGVGGGIAAYKAVELLRLLAESGHDVIVVPTESALRFVGAATWAALSHHPVTTDVWAGAEDVPHVRLGREADLVVVAPATADLLARAAHGLADDLLTNTLLTARCPVLLAPAMHTEMWEHPATIDNVATLRRRGLIVLDPATGRLTGADTGKGRLPEPAEIAAAGRTAAAFARTPCRSISSAGTSSSAPAAPAKPLDPVRFLGNASSGRQGYALATVAAARGATVTLVAANAALARPVGQRRRACHERCTSCATPCSRRPRTPTSWSWPPPWRTSGRPRRLPHKIKKTDDGPDPIPLVRNPDVLAELVAARRPGQVLVGFAAETGDDTGDVLAHGRAKLARKGCDLLVVNAVGSGRAFGRPDNAAVILDSDGGELTVARGPKAVLAAAVWDAVSARLGRIDDAGAHVISR